MALDRTLHCFEKNTNKYFHRNGNVYFSPFQSAGYAAFLYFMSNEAFKQGNVAFAEKCYLLNKQAHSVDWFYEVELPGIFFADHPLGSVMGRGKYSDYFSFAQGCTVGNNHGIYPTIGERVCMHPYSMIIGNSIIGDNVEISAYTFIRDEDIPSNCIVFGGSPNLTIVQKDAGYMKKRLVQFEY